MSKLPLNQIDQTIIDDDIWQDMDEYYDEYGSKSYWNGVISGNMSWQWYMEAAIRQPEGWSYVVVNDDYKDIMVEIWIKENYPDCKFKYERNHFLIEDASVATMVALKWT